MKINVLLVEGRRVLREGLCLLLEKHADIKCVGEADEADAAVKLVRALSPHVVILNVLAPSRASTESIRSIAAARPATRVLVLTLHPDPAFIKEMLQAGAAGCLTKECASEEMVTAIRAVAAKQIYLSPKITDAVVAGYVLPPKGTRRDQGLSIRERDILRRIADGETTKEIARALGVSSKTVETHRRRMMQKLGLHSVAELTKYAVREGLTSLEMQA
jgi:DNA-binding NarL/FixJ family response regulator